MLDLKINDIWAIKKGDVGYIITRTLKSKNKKGEDSVSEKNFYYSNLVQAFERVLHENIDGTNITKILESISKAKKDIIKALED